MASRQAKFFEKGCGNVAVFICWIADYPRDLIFGEIGFFVRYYRVFPNGASRLTHKDSSVGTTRKERRKTMPTYISLLTLTDQGIKNIKAAPARVEQAIKAMETGGGKFVGFYAVMGKYDYVIIGEAPSDEAMMSYMLSLGLLGNVKTTTMRAFNKEQFAELVSTLP